MFDGCGPNLVIEGVGENAEREWPGALLRLPDAEIRLADLRARCVMTTYDPDTIEQDHDVLRDIVRALWRSTLPERVGDPDGPCSRGRPRCDRAVDQLVGRQTDDSSQSRNACWSARWMAPFMSIAIRRANKKDLNRLKDLLENARS